MWSRISIPVLIKGCWYSVLQVLGTTQLPSEIIQSIAEDLGGYLWTMFRAFCVLNINNGIGLCVCACSSPIAVLNGALNTTIQTRRFVGALTPSRPTLAGNSKFRACDYNLIQNNCNHFSDTFASLICGNGACIVWHLWQRCVHCVTSVATVRALCDICGNGACIVWHLWQWCLHLWQRSCNLLFVRQAVLYAIHTYHRQAVPYALHTHIGRLCRVLYTPTIGRLCCMLYTHIGRLCRMLYTPIWLYTPTIGRLCHMLYTIHTYHILHPIPCYTYLPHASPHTVCDQLVSL